MNFYDRYILPPLLHCVCGTGLIGRQRARVVPAAHGQVLEIGIGSALNLQFYDAARLDRLTGIDPSRPLLGYARRRAAATPFPVRLLAARAEQLPLPEASIDTAVVTFSLCTIPDVPAALAEIRRVLKPGGRLLFCEHGLAPDTSVQRWQHRLEPLWGKLAGGCHLTRDIPQLLRNAAFDCTGMESSYLPYAPRFAGYVYRGSALAAAPTRPTG